MERNSNHDFTDGLHPESEMDEAAINEIKQLQQDIYNAFTSESGERVMDWMKQSFNDMPMFHEGMTPMELAHKEGSRYVYLQIQSIIDLLKG